MQYYEFRLPKHPLSIVLWAMFVVILLSACTVDTKNHGYSFSDLGDVETKLATIKPGKTNEIEVLQLLGSPSTISNYGVDKFFYIYSKVISKAFYRPQLKDQRVLEIAFQNHIVSYVKNYTMNDARIVQYDKHDIYIKANKLKIIEQLSKNFGRFNAKQHKR